MSEYAALDGHKGDPIVASIETESSPHWTMRTVVLGTLIAVGIGLCFLLLYRFYMIVFLFFVAFSLATAMKPIVGWLQKRNIPLVFGVLPIYLTLLGVIIGFVWFIGPLLITQFISIVREGPAYYASLRLYMQNSPNELLQTLGSLLPIQLSLPLTQLSVATTPDEPTDPIGLLGQAISNIGKTSFMLIAVLLLAYYWLIEGDVMIRRLVLRSNLERREQIRALITEIEGKIGGYFRGQLLLCLIVGLLSLVAFLLIGVPNALILGLISGVTEAVPFLGPTLGAVPAILMTLSTAPEKALWVVLAMVLIQSLENNFLVPRIMDKSVGVNPLITILSIAAFGLLFGFVGAILAIPLAAILQILVSRLLFSAPTSEEISSTPETSQPPARSRFAVLRLEAQELAQDVRKQARNHVPLQVYDAQIEQAEDMIESMAGNLESYLVLQEHTQ